MEEKELIKRAKQGDHSAFSILFRENYPLLVKYLLKVTMNPDAAEDLAQETMAKSLEKIHLFNGKSKFSTWLISISTNLFIDHHRKRKRENAWREQETDTRKLMWQMDIRNDEWSDALSALSRLSNEMRAAIILKHYYGYSYDEIGEMLRVSPGTVKSRVHNGLAAVRKGWIMMEKDQKKVLKMKREEEVSHMVNTINKGLGMIDRIDIVETPDEKWFDQFVAVEMKRQERKFRRDLVLFLLLAAVILSTIIFTLTVLPLLFLLLQAAAVLVTLFYTGKWLRKREGTA